MAMALYNFHRVLIAAAVVFFAAFTVYAFGRFNESGGAGNLTMALAAALATIVGFVYFVYFNIRLRRAGQMK